MAEEHVVRCDAEGCDREADLITIPTHNEMGLSVRQYVVPFSWKQIEDRQFCSWACVAAYAMRRTREESGDG